LFFLVAALLLIVGLRRAFASESSYRGRVSGPILAILSTAILVFFCFGVFVESRELPPSTNAPRVGQKAPPFSLPDTSGREESLSELLSRPIADGSFCVCDQHIKTCFPEEEGCHCRGGLA